jgi:hypothetical protein
MASSDETPKTSLDYTTAFRPKNDMDLRLLFKITYRDENDKK